MVSNFFWPKLWAKVIFSGKICNLFFGFKKFLRISWQFTVLALCTLASVSGPEPIWCFVCFVNIEFNFTLRQVSILLEAENQTEIKLILSYVVSNASWTPLYDLRAFTKDNTLQVSKAIHELGFWKSPKLFPSGSNTVVGFEERSHQAVKILLNLKCFWVVVGLIKILTILRNFQCWLRFLVLL